ncbi:MAG: amino acid adenylation domain-containing protein, partial [Acutalibacteraceae bacterium]|nr:amino acid adenylation domain-containing protein [Acutalibacteraceae bacterium]
MGIINSQIAAIYNLTPLQEGMLFDTLMNQDSTSYHLQMVYIIRNNLNVELVEKAWQLITKKHEVLRTVFVNAAGIPRQVVLHERTPEFHYCDLRHIKNPKIQIHNYCEQDLKRGFDLIKDVLLRVELIQTDESVYQMVVSTHHILMDGWCLSLIINDFISFYQALDQGSSVLEVQHQIEAGHQKEESYGSYLNWLSGLNQDEAMEYWKEYLDSYDNVAQFIPDETAIVIPQQTAEYELTLSKEESAEITAFINKLGITYNVLTESAYGILLQKSTHTKDVVFAKTVAGRNVEKHNYQNTVGLFINSIPLRIRDEQETVQELLFKVFSDDLKSGQYDYCSLADIQNMVPCGKELIKTIYIFQNYAVAETESTYLDIEMENGREQINYDIGLMAFMDDSQLTLRIMFNPRKFTYDNIVRINHMLKNILMDMVHFPEKKISEISEVSKRDSIRLIHDFNQTTVLCAKYKSYAELFEEQVEKTPENMAVVYENESLTYAELNARANVIAHKLRSMGIKPEDFVVICAERSIEMLVGIYGIIKSGAAYVPIDPTYPVERMNFILEDCKPKAVLVYHSNIPGELPIIDLSSIAWDMYRENLSIINKPDNLIYCIYTSGTTGKPKGVLLEHHGVVNLGMYLKHELSVTSSDRVMLFANYVFDGSVWEILMAHMNGVCLYIPSDDTIRDTALMEQFLNFHRITISYFPPIYYEQINVKLPGFVITAGSQTSRTAVIKAVKNSDYINSYGPTEASVCTTCWKLPKGSEVPDILPIGKPISNMQVYILNDNQLCGIGIPGELCIAGEGLARGYLNQPELTSKKFVNNPFGKGKIYRSGDLARWLPDGNIEYMGRIDEQVKIRGFRIELGEIESRLRELEEIGDCAVIARADRSEGQELYAYYTSDVEVSASKVRYALSKVLPSYMVPSYIMQIKEIPVTRNGKLDKRALPDIVAGVAAYVAPKTETEYCICNIFSEILNVEKVGIMDNFFDLGGHSLKLSQLVNQIEKQLFIRIPLKTIFQINSPKALANLIDEEKQKAKEFSLQPAAEKEFYPASAVQNRLYVLQQIDEKGIAYNTPNNLEFDCLFDHKRFQIAFQQMINRHEIFRTAFITQEHQIMQKVFPELQVTAEFVSVKREDLTEYYRKFIRPFQLNSPPLIKIHVAETEDQHSVMMIDMHHIIADGVSLGIFIDEFSKLYNGEKLETPVLQYKDYSEWMLTRTAELEKQKKYWLEQYADEIPVLDLPLDYSRGALQTFEGRTLSITLNSEITQECRRLAKITQTTEFMIFLSALMVLLSKYSGQEDIVVGMPIANRISSETENMIGMFVNTLAIRGKPEKEKTFMQFLNEMKEHMLKAYDNQEFPFDELINSLPLERDVSRNPLFDVFITMTNMDIGDYHMNGMRMLNNELSVESQTAKFDLTINIQPLKDTYCISFEYATSLFSESSISVMMKHYVNLLQCIAKNSYQPLKTMEMFDITERNLILNYFVSTEVDETLEQSVTDLLYEQVMLHPEKDAVIFDTKSITYSELWNKVKNVAVWLMKQGVQPGDCVAVFCSRSIEMVVGIYGVMLAGAAYVPIDPTYPEERIQYILKDCVPKAVLLELNTIQVSVPKNLPVLTISELPNNYTDEHIVFPRVVSHDLAYIIYTSGTTGKPKGVMVEHQGVLNLKKHFISAYQISEDDVVMKFANAVFDASVWEINMALLSGATLFIITQQMIEQEVLLNQAIHDYNVTIGAFPPNYLAQLSEDTFASMRLVVTAGSVATNEIAEKVSRNCIYVNEYGPTEITVSATYWRLEKGESVPFRIPIGKPIINKQIYIIREGNLCGIGEPGEICIAGVGIARGYLNQPELTKNHFIDNPFGTGKLYRTGDLARWLPDGNLDFLGRIDEQVKIRGYRIELSEIETVLRNQEHITDVAVITKQSSQNNDIYLCAYFVAEIQLDTEALKNIMRKQLPEYMIPQVMIQLDEIPVTHNGKLDKRALLEIHQKNQDDYVAPLDEIEYIVAEILGEILAYKPFGRTWNFFRMGGNSITGIRVISMLKQQLNVKISMPELFENPTVAQLAELCKSSKQMVENQIQVAKKCDAYPVSSIQRRMYSLQQISDGIAYNSPSSIHITGCLNPERMEYAFQQLLKREEILHTSFHMKDDLVQVVEESYTVDFTVEELGQRDPAEIFEAFVRPFDLEKAPLIRMMVLKETNTQWYLFMDIHHIICDGASIDILWNELWNLYYGNEIPKRTLHYKDYSVWMEKRASEIQKQGEYWLSQFDDQIPVLELPLDKVRPPYQSFEGDFLTYKVESALRKQVLALAEKTNCTEYMILLSALAILLSKQSRQEDLVIGSVVGGRMHPGMEDMIGMFVNSLALRIKPVGTMRYIEYLDVVKNSCLKAFDNQEYPLENLIEALHISRDNSRNPLFDVMLVLQNNVVNKDQPGELIIEEGVNQKGRTSKFDLSFNISSDVDDTYIIILEYCTALYKKETIERLIEHYIEILKQVTENKDKKLKEIEMVTEKERHQILNNFNSTEAEYSRDKTVIELFEEQAARVPDKIAVNYKERSLTFRELNEKANAVAEQLINSGAD